MTETFYAVNYIINERSGTMPHVFKTKSDAIVYAKQLDKLNKDHEVKTEVHVYECKEISYK